MVQTATASPVWNESLIFTQLFPPLCQRIKFQIRYTQCACKTVHGIRYVNLRSISNDREQGFLPTFGPTYLHFYLKNGEGYAGKVLLSLDTILYDESLGIPKSVAVQTVTPIKVGKTFSNY